MLKDPDRELVEGCEGQEEAANLTACSGLGTTSSRALLTRRHASSSHKPADTDTCVDVPKCRNSQQ